MKVIFTDVSGVLNDSNSFNDYLDHYYDYVEDTTSLKGYDDNKFRLLSDICKKYNAGIVLSSSWKSYFSDNLKFNNELTRIINEFKKYDIPFYGFTPNLKLDDVQGRETWIESNIFEFLAIHPEFDSYCILSTNNYNLSSFEDNIVITEYNEDGLGNGGLLPKHDELIGKALSRKMR